MIRTASITRKRKKRVISWGAIFLVAVTVPEDIVKSSSAGKESRCDMTELEKTNESLKKLGEALGGVSMQARISSLEKEIKDKQCQIEEMQNHIDCLKADLEGSQKNKIQLPSEPIKVAMMLIDAGYAYQNTDTGMQHRVSLYSKSDLRQIARHLLVYCNNSEDE